MVENRQLPRVRPPLRTRDAPPFKLRARPSQTGKWMRGKRRSHFHPRDQEQLRSPSWTRPLRTDVSRAASGQIEEEVTEALSVAAVTVPAMGELLRASSRPERASHCAMLA
jgi:hypothetical protein